MRTRGGVAPLAHPPRPSPGVGRDARSNPTRTEPATSTPAQRAGENVAAVWPSNRSVGSAHGLVPAHHHLPSSRGDNGTIMPREHVGAPAPAPGVRAQPCPATRCRRRHAWGIAPGHAPGGLASTFGASLVGHGAATGERPRGPAVSGHDRPPRRPGEERAPLGNRKTGYPYFSGKSRPPWKSKKPGALNFSAPFFREESSPPAA